ncbi:N-Acetylglucosaminyltransferase-IV region [Ancylostoma duodenale]|uniref:N-Acetylglucosaminyltransferase-IV region n=1 Tax=Ancylostoma duodenale TaxID=51022 RepID=A0A0C2CR54_9BILA|nr:N-Acetylglucosaminyltransferase-IV region [Ancylostoma duodenale]
MFATPDTSTDAFKKLSNSVIFTYANKIEEGLLEVAIIPPKWYESQPESIRPTFGDSKQRMQWRIKQNLDYFYLMNYGRQKADYYMHLEDDIWTTPKYARTILNYLQLKEGRPWFSMHFSTLGFIGKLFRSEDVKIITNAIASYYKYKPVDWIFLDVERSITCSPEYNADQCNHSRRSKQKQVIDKYNKESRRMDRIEL